MKKIWVIIIAAVVCLLFALHSFKHRTISVKLEKESMSLKQELDQCQVEAEMQMEAAKIAQQEAEKQRAAAILAAEEARAQKRIADSKK